jgi:hypothetical protein
MSITKLIAGAIVAGCLFAVGCVVSMRPEAEVAIGVEQPAPPVEVITSAPEVDFVWIPGWWWWDGGRWAWHGGYWGHGPHPGAVWVPHTWGRGPHGGWVHHGGRWR